MQVARFGEKMTEGRHSQVVLLDDRRLEILIKPKLYAGELLDMVASHFNLKEKEYFGLAYVDDTGHYSWLQLDRRVLEHEFPKKTTQGILVLYFLVKYFVESITHLRDSTTVEAFYLQAQSLVYKGTVDVSSETAFNLAALVLQATHGDYLNDQATKTQLKKLPVLPTSALKEHPSLTVCEEKIIQQYKTLAKQTRGAAIVNYMTILETLPTYGVHYYEVKDKGGIPWWLGISYKGVSQYDHTDRKVPRKVFLWKQLENLYFRDRKFSIEVHDPRRVVHTLSSLNLYEDAIEEPLEECDELSNAVRDPTTQVSVSRRTFGPGNVTVYVWFAATPALTKCIWSMSIAQHQFYLDRKHKSQLPVSRTLAEIASDLSPCLQSLSSNSTPSLSRSTSSHSLPALKIDCDPSEEAKVATLEMLVALKARKEALEEALLKKTEELKTLCIREGELTGILPPETPLTPGEQLPKVRRRVGTSFSLNDRLILKVKTKDEEDLAKLELEYEIQSKITTAALKLASDTTAKKNVRRQRKLSHQQAQAKLRELEQKLNVIKKQVELSRRRQLRQHSDEETSEDNISHSTDDSDPVFQESGVNLSDLNLALSPNIPRTDNDNNRDHCCSSPAPTISSSSSSPHHESTMSLALSSNSAPPSPVKPRHHQKTDIHPHPASQPATPTSSHADRGSQNLEGQGYKPSSVYQTRTSYRTQQYPTLPTRSPSKYSANMVYDDISPVEGGVTLQSPYQNKFESTLNLEGSNLYSVPTQRTSQAFDSQDDILASLPSDPQDLGLMSRHNSLDRTRRHSYQRYRHHANNHIPVSASLPHSTSYSEHMTYHHALEEGLRHHHSLPHHYLHHHHGQLHHPPHHPHHFHHHRHHPHNFAEPVYIEKEGTRNFSNMYSPSCDVPDGSHSGYGPSLPCPSHMLSPIHQFHCEEASSGFYSNEQIAAKVYNSHAEIRTLNSSPVVNSEDTPSLRESPTSSVLHGSPLLSPRSFAGSQSTIYNDSLYSSPSMKAKEWTETSLDSPLPSRKNRPLDLSMCDKKIFNYNSPSEIHTTQTHSDVELQHQIKLPHSQEHRRSLAQTKSPSKLPSLDPSTPVSPASTHFVRQRGVEVNIVSVGHFQPYWEETKPYEISDFYKYSTKHRKQQMQQQQQQQQASSQSSVHPAQRLTVNDLTCHVVHSQNYTGQATSPVPELPSSSVPSNVDEAQPESSTTSSPYSKPQVVNQQQQIRQHITMTDSGALPSVTVTDFQHEEKRDCQTAGTPNCSFSFEMSPQASVADAFHDEMLAWYADHEKVKKATLV